MSLINSSSISPNRGDLGQFLEEPTDSSDEEGDNFKETSYMDKNDDELDIFDISPDHKLRLKIDEQGESVGFDDSASLFKQKLQESLSTSHSFSPHHSSSSNQEPTTPSLSQESNISSSSSVHEEYKRRLQEKLMERMESEKAESPKQTTTDKTSSRRKNKKQQTSATKSKKFKVLDIKPGQRIRVRASGR